MIKISNRSIVLIILLTLLSSLFEAIGIGMFYPIFQILKQGKLDADESNPEIIQYIYDVFGIVGVELTLPTILISVFMLFIFRQLFMYIKNVYIAKVHYFILRNLRNTIFGKYLLSKVEYQDNLQIGVFSNIVTSETNVAVGGIMGPIYLITHFIMLLILLFMLLLISPYMTIIVSIVLFLSSYSTRYWIKKSKEVGLKIVKINTSLTSFLIERIKSTRLVKLSSNEDNEIKEFNMLSDQQRRYFVLASVLTSKTSAILDPIVIGLSLVFLYISHTYTSISIELIGIYFLIVMRMLPVAKSIIQLWQKIKGSLGSIEFIQKKIIDMDEEREFDSKKVNKTFVFNTKIEYIDVSYKYPLSEKNAVTNISFTINSGDMIALVGPSGGGKSTIIDLLPKLREPSSGNILIDGVKLSGITFNSVRGRIAYVQQDPQIFTSKVKDHIGYGNSNLSLDEIKHAAKLTGADGFISELENGYDTVLSDNAGNLSGGQRRRLDLARALASNSPILILDEPTSNLDIKSEQSFIKTLLNIKNKTSTTIIIVAHSLASVKYADQILVINNGIIEERGNHNDLLHKDCWYSDAWNKKKNIN